MKLLSVLALVLCVSATSFAQEGGAAAQPAGASAGQPAAAAPADAKPAKMKKKKHGHKKAKAE